MSDFRQLAKTSFVNTVGKLPNTSLIDKLASWIRFSHWCIERGASLGRYDERSPGKYDDRYRLYERAILHESLERQPIDYLEFGVAEGASIAWWAKRMIHPDARFFGFDTFTGLPEKWAKYPPNTFSTNGNIPHVPDPRVRFYKGLFQHTVPAFLRRFSRRSRIVVHLDADLYSSTLFALTALSGILEPDDFLFFDEFAAPTSEFRAFDDFVSAYLVKYEVIGAVNSFNRVCVKLKQVANRVECLSQQRPPSFDDPDAYASNSPQHLNAANP